MDAVCGGTLVTAYNGSYGPVPLIYSLTLVRADNRRVALSAISTARTHRTMRATAVICRLYHTMYTSICRSCSSDSEKHNFYTVKYKSERVLAAESRFSACTRRRFGYQRRVRIDRGALPPSDIVYATQCTYIFVDLALLIQKNITFT